MSSTTQFSSSDLLFTVVFSRALCVRYWWVWFLFFIHCSLSFFSVWLSFLPSWKILFGVLILSITRHLLKMDHTAGCLASSPRSPATPRAPPRPGAPPPCQTASLFTWLKNCTWNAEGLNKGRELGGNRAMRSRVVGRGPTRQEINSWEIFN